MLTVNLTEPWQDAAALYALDSISTALSHPKHLVISLSLGLINIITLIGSLTASTTALVQQVHTADHVNSLSRNISLALFTQEGIDKNLETRLIIIRGNILYQQ